MSAIFASVAKLPTLRHFFNDFSVIKIQVSNQNLFDNFVQNKDKVCLL